MHVYHCALRVTYRKLYFQTKTEEKILGLVKKKGSKFSLGYVSLKTCRKTVQLPSKNLLCFSDSMTLNKIWSSRVSVTSTGSRACKSSLYNTMDGTHVIERCCCKEIIQRTLTVTHFSSQTPGYNPRAVSVEFVMEQCLLQILPLSFHQCYKCVSLEEGEEVAHIRPYFRRHPTSPP